MSPVRPSLRRLAFPLAASLAFVFGCEAPEERGPVRERAVNAPIQSAFCTAVVQGKGARDTETDYIPHVIACENGGANLEALKAQAIAARSVLYYAMATSGSICDGQGCQVYSCGNPPSAIHYQAAAETAGQYLSYGGLLTYGFYVDGDHSPDPGTCKGSPQGNNEKYVTYNAGKTGNGVQQTSLGYIGPPGFGQNRGCMAQWGARCLENTKGKGHADILRFYYGDDIQILTAPGNCTGCEPGCDGTKIISADCGEGDCAAFGANCVDDDKGPRCVFFACPPQGTAKVCLDEMIIGDCVDGQISTGDCSKFAAYCSTKVGDEARCVSHFCATPQEQPVPHEGCFLDGQPYACDELGQIQFDPCPEGQHCSVYPQVHCEADLGCPAEGEGAVCLTDTVIGQCYGGGVPSTLDCALQGSYCAIVDGVGPSCVPEVCLDAPGDVPSDHDVCLGDGRVGHCFADGSLVTSDCPPGLACVDDGGGAHCGDPEPMGSSGGVSSSGGEASSSSSSSGGEASSSDGTATGGLTSGELDGDEAGCGCIAGRAGGGPGDGPGDGPWLGLFALGLWRRRARRRA